jgi:hypothetical protein
MLMIMLLLILVHAAPAVCSLLFASPFAEIKKTVAYETSTQD